MPFIFKKLDMVNILKKKEAEKEEKSEQERRIKIKKQNKITFK